jgi:hypothetical protein
MEWSMGEYRSLGVILAAIFALLLLGARFSPTYTQQMGYLHATLLGGSLLFIASVVVIVAAIGFRTFALYLALLVGMAIAAFGLLGGWLVLGLTYASWGFVFALQLLLALNDVPSAIAWFRRYYTWETFRTEYRFFYPMLWVMYLLLEVLPRLIYRDRLLQIHPKETLRKMEAILRAPPRIQ